MPRSHSSRLSASWAAGTAVALALHEELTRRAPERLSVGLLLCPRVAVRAWRRSEKPVPADTVIVELGACGGGEVAWAARHPQLVAAAGDRGRRLPGGRAPLPTLTVGGLDAAASARLVTGAFGPVRADRLARLHRATAGNPLALLELAADVGVLVQRRGQQRHVVA